MATWICDGEVTQDWGKLHNYELHNSYSSQNFKKPAKYRGHSTRGRGDKYIEVFRLVFDAVVIFIYVVEWIHLAQRRMAGFRKNGNKHWGYMKGGNLLTVSKIIGKT
jgi:hypothetical protein